MEGAEHYASAKVVVLGDPGVGKTALARALVGLPFVRTEPTHMRRVRKLADEVVAVDGLRVRRETLLWDLGQPGYPVLHRLALSGTDLALVVFDPERIEEPDHVGAWMQGLRLAQDHERTPRHIRTFLVAARVDRRARHTPPQLRKRILDLAGTLGVEGYFETSALTGAVSELRAAIRAAIPWQDMATFEMNDRTRAVIDKLRHRREQGDVVIDAPRLVAVLGDPELVVDRWTLRTAVAIEENRGRVHSMSRGGVLLRPRLLDQYAEALINAANAELNGLGTIADELARVGTFMQQFGNAVAAPSELTDEDALDPSPADERARDLAGRLVRAMIDELVDHGIALRVETADQSYLMLPSQLQPSREELAPVDDVSAAFAFDGDASRVFATLLVAVAYGSSDYSLRERWQNAATFVVAAGGICGVRLQSAAGEPSSLALFFDGVVSADARSRFAGLIREHLERTAVVGSVVRRQIVVCTSCGYVFPPRVVAARLERGFDAITCPVCDTRLSLVELSDARPGEHYLDVYLSHSPEDKAVVRQLADQLRAGGLRLWVEPRAASSVPAHEVVFDESRTKTLERIEDVLGRVSSMAICIGSRGLHEWESGAVNRLINAYVHEVGMPMFVVLLPGSDAAELPAALQRTAQVDMRGGVSGEPVDQLALFVRLATAPAKGTPLSHEAQAGQSPLGITRDDVRAANDALEIRLALDRGERRDVRRIAMAVARRLRAANPVVVEAPPLPSTSAWDIELPATGLRVSRGLLVVLSSADAVLLEEASRLDGPIARSLVVCADLDDALIKPEFARGASVVRLGSRELREMTELAEGQVAGWLGRLITQQVDIEPMLPYRAAGATALFFGRDDELKRLIGEGRRGGVILGVHQSGKSSLLHELQRRLERDRVVVGPITLSDSLDGFYERTLEPLAQSLDEATPIEWARRIRAFASERGAPVFLLDEVDWLVRFDATTGYKLGSAMRALQQDRHAEFYVAGHLDLRSATRGYGSPFRNFADEVVLTGLARAAAMRLIREPIHGIGFEINEDQADRIFRGTAGMAALIQDFCGRLLTGLRGGEGNVISDDAIAHVEDSPAYLDRVFQYFYDYDENAVSRAVFLLTAVARQVTRTSIADLLGEHRVAVSAGRIDASLTLLASFGILDQHAPGEYRIPGRYLQRALAVRGDLDALLAEQIAGLGKAKEKSR